MSPISSGLSPPRIQVLLTRAVLFNFLYVKKAGLSN